MECHTFLSLHTHIINKTHIYIYRNVNMCIYILSFVLSFVSSGKCGNTWGIFSTYSQYKSKGCGVEWKGDYFPLTCRKLGELFGKWLTDVWMRFTFQRQSLNTINYYIWMMYCCCVCFMKEVCFHYSSSFSFEGLRVTLVTFTLSIILKTQKNNIKSNLIFPFPLKCC